jgi:predicted DNA-binding protein (UPF0251 family)/predicted Fe-Mo cluster-binding NifX family protein
MPRPRLCRKVSGTPKATYFKPRGVPLGELDEVRLAVEGLEALRLADLESLTTSEAAGRMGVSRHTFGRILGEARRAVSQALVNAMALRIEGGEYSVADGQEHLRPAKKKPLDRNVIAISAQGPSLTDMVDSRLGRAAGFVVVDLETMSTRYVDNGQAQAMAHGAGIQTVELLVDAGAGVLLTGVVGPKAFKALDEAGIKVGLNVQGITVGEAVARYKAGKVPFADGPNK